MQTSLNLDWLPPSLLAPNPFNPRPFSFLYGCKVYDLKVAELVASIGRDGFDESEPIQVFPVGDLYQIQSGHHRYVAALVLELELVPCFVLPSMSELELSLRLVSRQGKSIEPWYVAEHAYRTCVIDGLTTQTEYARHTGFSKAQVSKWIGAMRLQTEYGQPISLSTAAADAITRLPLINWVPTLCQAELSNWSVVEVEDFVRSFLKNQTEERRRSLRLPSADLSLDSDLENFALPESNHLLEVSVPTPRPAESGEYFPATTGLNSTLTVAFDCFLDRHIFFNAIVFGLGDSSESESDLIAAVSQLDVDGRSRLISLLGAGGRVIVIGMPLLSEAISECLRLESQLVWHHGVLDSLSERLPQRSANTNWQNVYKHIDVFNGYPENDNYFGLEALRNVPRLDRQLTDLISCPPNRAAKTIGAILVQAYVPNAGNLLFVGASEAIVAAQKLRVFVAWTEGDPNTYLLCKNKSDSLCRY